MTTMKLKTLEILSICSSSEYKPRIKKDGSPTKKKYFHKNNDITLRISTDNNALRKGHYILIGNTRFLVINMDYGCVVKNVCLTEDLHFDVNSEVVYLGSIFMG